MKKWLTVVLAGVLACSFFLVGCKKETSGASLMADFSTETLEGAEVNQSIFSDYKITMVNVWATFCTPCLSEMPDLGELAEEVSEQGVQIVGLVSDTLGYDGGIDQEQVRLAQEIVAETKADYLHLLPSEDLFDLLGQIDSVPTTFFVDQEGNQVGNAYLGAKSKQEWNKIIAETLKEV